MVSSKYLLKILYLQKLGKYILRQIETENSLPAVSALRNTRALQAKRKRKCRNVRRDDDHQQG